MEDERRRRYLAQMARDAPQNTIHTVQSSQGPEQGHSDQAQSPDGRDHEGRGALRGGGRLELA